MMPKEIHNENDDIITTRYPSVSRRQFFKQMGVLGGGIIVYFTTGDSSLWARMKRHPNISTDFNAFLRIDARGRVTCYMGKIEMGQGPITSLPQMLAEELDVSYDSVEIIMGDTDLCPWDMGTWYYGIIMSIMQVEEAVSNFMPYRITENFTMEDGGEKAGRNTLSVSVLGAPPLTIPIPMQGNYISTLWRQKPALIP